MPNQMPILMLMMKGMELRQEILDKMSPEEQANAMGYLIDLMMDEPKEVLTKLMKEENLGAELVEWLKAEKIWNEPRYKRRKCW